MSLIDFLNQTCSIFAITSINVRGTVINTPNEIHTDIPCYMYEDKRDDVFNQRATEDNVGNIKIILKPNITDVKSGYRVKITDPDVGFLGEYILENPEVHRSFLGIGGISFRLNKLENGES